MCMRQCSLTSVRHAEVPIHDASLISAVDTLMNFGFGCTLATLAAGSCTRATRPAETFRACFDNESAQRMLLMAMA